ncbi:MAG: hypothetical protein U1E26_09910 [Coriobacteriia bacterium]|nr:hypothetical protein [Coriobacteriia bacterium]
MTDMHLSTRAGVTLAIVCALAAVATAYAVPRQHVGASSAHAAASPSTEASPNVAALMAIEADAHHEALAPFEAEGETGEAVVEESGGLEGPEGPAGLDGIDGVDGVDGVDGEEGPEGPAGPAGTGLVESTEPTGGVAVVSPDGTSYRVIVTDAGIFLQGPDGFQVWRAGGSGFETFTAEVTQ